MLHARPPEAALFQSIGRFVDPTTTSRRWLALLLLVTTAWSITWGWLVAVFLEWLGPKLLLLLAWLFALLFPSYPPLQLLLEPPPLLAVEVVEVEVEVDAMDLSAQEASWEADEPVLTEDALADAEALWEARQDAERRALERQAMDRAIAESAGILGALIAADEAVLFSDLALDSAIGSDEFIVEGGLVGTSGLSAGYGGLGSRGSGVGGGGSGLGGLGTKGLGEGHGRVHGLGSVDAGSSVAFGDPVALGPLEPDSIGRVVARHASQIRYCYQRELAGDPSLAGAVTFQVQIQPDGSVSDAKVRASTLKNDSLEACIQGRFLRMMFPEREAATVVSQPLTLAPDA